MVDLTIEFIGDDTAINESFRTQLSGAGVQSVSGRAGSVVSVRDWGDCERLGEQISRFIGERNDSFKLRIDGPGADSLLHEVRKVADVDSMTRFLATSAYFQ